jgi:hypothetical protein
LSTIRDPSEFHFVDQRRVVVRCAFTAIGNAASRDSRLIDICLQRKKINISTVLTGLSLGIKEVDDGIRLVSLMDYDLGYFDHETCGLEPLDNPFGPKVLPMSPV